MVDTIESFYKDKITMLKERVESERFERKVAQQAQAEVSYFMLEIFRLWIGCGRKLPTRKKTSWRST